MTYKSDFHSSERRITFLISSLAGGGAEGVCSNVASGLADNGKNIELIVLNMNNSVYHQQLSERVKFTVLGVNQARQSFLPLIRYLNSSKPEQLVVFNYELAYVMVIIRPFLRFRFRLVARNINTFSANVLMRSSLVKRYFINPVLRFLYSRVDHIVNQCVAMQSDLLNSIPIKSEQTSVIYNPVNRAVEHRAKHESKVKTEPGYVLCVGRLEYQKAFERAIAAFVKVHEALPDIRLKFLGKGSEEERLRQLAIEVGLDHLIDFEGFSLDAPSYYLGAYCVVLTSLYEGFPNVLVEALTLGVPVVSVDCPSGPAEIVQSGVNGLLVKSYDSDALADAIQKTVNTDWSSQQIKQTALRYSNAQVLNDWGKLLSSGRDNE